MFQIREGVFETNSSSTHCVVVTKNHGNVPPLEPDHGSLIVVELGEFGWGPECFNDFYKKLQYVLTMIYETEYATELDIEIKGGNLPASARNEFQPDLFKNTFGFTQVDDLIYEYCGYRLEPLYAKYCGIDHQSCENYSDINDFLDDNDVSLPNLLFDTGIYIVLTDDNGGTRVEEFPELKGNIERVSPVRWDPDEDDEDISFHEREGRFRDEDAEEFPDFYEEEA